MGLLGLPVILGLLCLLLLLLGACRGRAIGTFEKAPVVVVSIDTLRSDHLPAYGYSRVETPAIDALRRDAVLFERAYSQVPLTLPSHLSILTGLLPAGHGVRDNVGYRLHADRVPYLPKILGKAGYATGAAVSTYVLRGETGIADGFDFYESSIDVRTNESLGRSQRPGAESERLLLDWIDQVKARPFFALLHLYEPHTPYEPPEPFASRYRDRPYDGEIAAADAVVGSFLDALKQRGLYERTIVVLLSDHGEGLNEHGEQEHGIFLYREALQVPLLLKLPGERRKGETAAAPVALVDLAPTLLQLLGIAPPSKLDGTSLLAALDQKKDAAPERAIYAETYYPRFHLGWSELTSLVRDRFHYIQGPDPELYDLAADPGEKTSILTRERRAFAAMREELRRLERPAEAPSQEDAETAAKLAALGYLGGGPAAASSGGGPLPDPKAHIDTLRDFGLAFQHFSRGEYAEAVPVFERLLAGNPLMVDAWENLGISLQRLGRREEALAAYQKGMKVSGGVGHLALATATLLLDMGRYDEAKQHAELGLESSPAAAHSLLAQVAMAKGDAATAEREAKAALGARGSRIGPLMTMAQVLAKQGKLQEALKYADDGERELQRLGGSRSFQGLRFVRGDVLARLGRNEEAERAFLQEIEAFPTDLKSYSRLAVLYAAEGRAEEAVDVLHRMVKANESPAAYAEAVRTLRVMGNPQGAAALLRYALTLHPESKELRTLAVAG
jgi:arylsulfatase A-like enzyme/Flp pilus assembly protein TadD